MSAVKIRKTQNRVTELGHRAGVGRQSAQLSRVVSTSLFEKVRCDQSLEEGEGVSHPDLWGRTFQNGRGNC